LADRTKPHPTKERIGKFKFVLFGRERIVGKPQDLGTILHSLRIAMMTRERTAAEYLGNIVGFSPMHIPRLVTWGHVREILGFLDPLFLNG
jgi:hypothetical protein